MGSYCPGSLLESYFDDEDKKRSNCESEKEMNIIILLVTSCRNNALNELSCWHTNIKVLITSFKLFLLS